MTLSCKLCRFSENYLFDVSQLLARILLFRIFFFSGMTKIQDWDTTLFLFELEYAVPILPVPLAAFLATFSELVFAGLILVGALTKLSVIPLMIMTLVIEFVVGAMNPAFSNFDHYMYFALLFVLMCKGAGRYSIDYFINKYFWSKYHS